MKMYMKEMKLFYRDKNGLDHQTADLGVLPSLFTSRKKADTNLQKTLKMFIEIYDEEIVDEIHNATHSEPHLICRYTLQKKDTSSRSVISLYEVEPF